MANLNIPFLLWQKENCKFDPDPSTLKIFKNIERIQPDPKFDL